MRSLLKGHASRQRDTRYLEVTLIVKAIIAGAALTAGNSKSLDDLQEMLKEYTDLVYPEQAYEMEDKKAKVARIMEREFAQGPMKVQAQDYDKKRRKKQWRNDR